jgi:hypothetical protein
MKGGMDRSFWLAMLISAAVLIPRAVLITRAHNESWDDDIHLSRGLWYLTRSHAQVKLNNPPLGEGLVALPLPLMGVLPDKPLPETGLYGYRVAPETIRLVVTIWMSILLLPMCGIAFLWCRQLYGPAAGWLALALILVDPNIAAHAPLPVLDLLSAGGIVIACFVSWRYFQQPGGHRLIAAAVAVATALMLKHTALILPGVVIAMAIAHRFMRGKRGDPGDTSIAPAVGIKQLALGALLVFLAIWALTLFDFSPPLRSSTFLPRWYESSDWRARLLRPPLPAGSYIGSVAATLQHTDTGHPGYLWGQVRSHGWWYYFPIVATYKVPIATGLLIVLALASFLWRRPRFDEAGLLIPLLAWTIFLMIQSIDIGFRIFFPAYLMLLMLASRTVTGVTRGVITFAAMAIAATAIDGARFHPDYIAYTNFPRHKVYLQISDSNVDWGQGIVQAGRWIAEHADWRRPVYICPHIDDVRKVHQWVDPRVIVLGRDDGMPKTGLLVISPVHVAGVYNSKDQFAALRSREPIAVIGHCMLVFDLDASRHALSNSKASLAMTMGRFWPMLSRSPAAMKLATRLEPP